VDSGHAWHRVGPVADAARAATVLRPVGALPDVPVLHSVAPGAAGYAAFAIDAAGGAFVVRHTTVAMAATRTPAGPPPSRAHR
jgi:hypothetical protein